MIKVKVRKDVIRVSGHAGYAPLGQDIVCSAVSILVQNMVASIEELSKDKIEYDLQPGEAWVRYTEELTDVAKTLVDSFFIGICAIADDYPEYVQIV